MVFCGYNGKGYDGHFFLRRERSRVNGGKKSCGVNKDSKGLKVDISVERERGTALMDSEHVSQLREQ